MSHGQIDEIQQKGQEQISSVRFAASEAAPLSPNSTGSHSYINHFDDDQFSEATEPLTSKSSASSRRNEQAVSINLSARNYTKLEIIKAKDITTLLWWIHGVISFALLFCIILVILANTIFLNILNAENNEFTLSGLQGLRARYYLVPRAFDMFVFIANMLCFVYILSLTTVFTKRISNLRRKDRTHEQVWVVFLTISAALYMNPFENIVRLLEKIGIKAPEAAAYRELALFYDSVKDAAFSASTLFYVWASVHSYRVLERKLTRRFYIPKVSVVVLYVVLKISAFWISRIYFAEMPFASIIGMMYLFGILGEWKRSSIIWVSFITVYEVCLVIAIFYEIRKTRNFLRSKDYMTYRTKQIGFRFFLYHNFTFYVLFWLCYIMLLLSLPPGAQIVFQKLLNVVYVEVQYLPLGLYVFYLSYVTVEAFANMPADAIGWKGWLQPQEPKIDADMEPIMYRKREPKGQQSVGNTLVMESAVTMFNFSWLAYYYNTDKMNRLRGNLKTNFDYKVSEFISNKQTDTNVLVVDGSDRIIVSFQGTKSFRNLMTDLNAFYTKLNGVLPTGLIDGNDENDEIFEIWDNNAKIHRGFADAYMSVSHDVISAVRHQYFSEPRPIYLSGHSLGGALATLCALDLLYVFDLSSEDVVVITFGAPRVGNKEFQNIYDNRISSHWRVVIAPDLIPSLPKVGYVHIGKKVLLTASGDLFIDPNSMEMSLWGKQAQSLLYHRKSSYLLAMRSWCKRHDKGAYKPPFWEWPVTEEDSKRFPEAFVKQSRDQDVISTKDRRFMLKDAMITALGNENNGKAGIAAKNWAKLTRRLLEEHE